MSYLDGAVIAVPTANKETYLQHAEKMAVAFKQHGALQLMEAWGDDISDGEQTSFPMAVKCKDDETVVFSWILWPSKEVRDAGMQAIMSDESLHAEMGDMPFDGSRMIFGGFEVLASL